MKKAFFVFILSSLFNVLLFSFTPRQERFLILNLTSLEFLIDLEYFISPTTADRFQRMGNIDIIISYFKSTESIIKPGEDYFGVLSYYPFANNWDEFTYYRTKLGELSFGEKMKAIFKTFSMRSSDGRYIIMDIDDLINANIKKLGDSYILEIYDEDIKYE